MKFSTKDFFSKRDQIRRKLSLQCNELGKASTTIHKTFETNSSFHVK